MLELLLRMPRPLAWGAALHALLALGCLGALMLPSEPLIGVHPALKPLKFAISISLFLGTLGLLLPAIAVAAPVRSALAWMFTITMVLEMGPILGQAWRGTRSHFNEAGGLDTVLWRLMMAAIVVASTGMVGLALLACVQPLLNAAGRPMDPLLALAWRAGLWLLCLSPVSGFAMGGRMQHSVGGADGGPGLPFVDWSVLHGDLRVSHFIALHAMQLLPLLAWGLLQLGVPVGLRWTVFLATLAGTMAACLGTLMQALAGRPLLGGWSG